MAAAARIAVARAATVAVGGAALALFLGLAMGAFVGLDQRLTVGDRDLIVVRVDFAERQEAVAVAAIFDERRLQRRLYARDLGEIDIAAQLPAARRLEVELLDPVSAQHHHPGLLRVGGVDEHLVGHGNVSRRACGRPRRAETGTGSACGAPNWGLNEWRWIVRARPVGTSSANAVALPKTLVCLPGRRGDPASCALSMILNLDWTATCVRRGRGFFVC